MPNTLRGMKKGYEDAPYHSMGTKPPKRREMAPVIEDEFQRGKEAGPAPRPAPPRDIMIPTPEEEARMKAQVDDERMMRQMEEAYDKSRGSMRRAKGGSIGYAGGGSVGSASKRADGCAQRGKTKGRII
jgi:hypothetical protein